MNNETIEGAKLVIKIAGGEFKHSHHPYYVTFSPVTFGNMSGDYGCKLEDCHFHCDWSWQIPVWSTVIQRVSHIAFKESVSINPAWKAYQDFKTNYETGIRWNKPEHSFKALVRAIEFLNRNSS